MRSISRRWPLPVAVAAACVAAQLAAPSALAQPEPSGTEPVPAAGSDAPPAAGSDAPPAGEEVLHNIVYRARVDGVSRGATITYRADGDQFHTANPTMVPGRVFEANAVLPASQIANIRVSIEWPYSANLHCEILVDDAVVAQADDFVGPRLTPQREDPDFGALTCQAPVSGIDAVVPAAPPPPADPAEPVADVPPPPT